MKNYWCKAPDHLNDVPVELWINVSQTTDGCRIFDIEWQDISSKDITVS